jgi:hypothetical protein
MTVTDVLLKMLDSSAAKVVTDERNNAVIVSGPPKTHERVKQLIEGLDVSEPDATRVNRVYRLEHADPVSVGRTLSDLLADKAMSVGVDKRARSVIVSAPAEVHPRAAEFIEQLDVPARQRASRQFKVKVFRLQHAEAEEMAKMVVNALGPEGSVAADDRTNSILVTGPEEELEVIEAVLLRLDEEAEDHRQEAVPTACQVRIVWLTGPMPGGGTTPPAGLKEVVDELAGIGIKDLRHVAHTLVNTQVGGAFRLRCSPALNDEPLPMTVSGNVTQREGTPILSIQILAESPVETGAEEGSSVGIQPPVDLETVIAAPYGHYVVLGVAPVEVATSAFVVQIVPGKQ